jgi:hypothetical protein
MLTKNDLLKLFHARMDPLAISWGFQCEPRDSYLRPHGDYWHGFAMIMNWHGPNSFYLEIGIHFPFLHESALFIDQIDYRGFEISHRLGNVREEGARGVDEWYRFINEKELNREMDRMIRHFEAWALPWYERFKTVDDAVTEFYKNRIEDLPENRPRGAGPSSPDPHGWAMYGWMLEKLDRKQEASEWLRRAYNEVTRPLFMKDGRFVAEGVKGARKVRHPEAEERLEESLRQSLGLPVP